MNKYLQLAIDNANQNPVKKLPKLAAVLVTRDGGIFVGFNRYKSHPLQKLFGSNEDAIYLHAEIDAIVQATRAGRQIEASSLYVARTLRDGSVALAMPCKGCQKAIAHFNIANVEWTCHTK